MEEPLPRRQGVPRPQAGRWRGEVRDWRRALPRPTGSSKGTGWRVFTGKSGQSGIFQEQCPPPAPLPPVKKPR